MTKLIEQLCSRTDAEGCWRISAEEVASLLGIEQVRFWRAVHEVRDRISFSDAIDGWSQDTVGDLVTLLERFVGAEAEERMTQAGLFLPYALGIELTEEVVFRSRRLAAGHEIREEELAAMLRHTGSVRAAVRIYLGEYVDLDSLLEESVESFLALHGLPLRGKATARLYLARMLERHLLDRRALLIGLEERLRLAAAQLGYVDPEDQPREGQRREAGSPRRRDRRAWARRVMGLDGARYSTVDLRHLYRKLMMRHHPDVDPSGLERCKDVNAAYALLISELTDPG
ncbi:MAG TPA: J domain-containing protein [Spirochaetia bacterium]|nr:J domain-containing protein [Spirochaetia bacterium]